MYIFDTGPIFKFLTTDCVPQLLVAIGHNTMNVPEAVDFEINGTPLLCPTHNTMIDTDVSGYPAEPLFEFKQEHEKAV